MSDPVFEIGGASLGVSEEQMKVLINKTVNSETPGFKESEVMVRSFPVELESAEKKLQPMVPKIEGTYYNFQAGALIKTGNPTDLALGGNGFFVIFGPWGEGYTRDGRFKLDEQGHLLSTAGSYPLLGQSGPIQVPAGSQIEITQNGDIKVNQQVIDRIRVVEMNDADRQNLISLNGSIFKAPEGKIEIIENANPRVVQGYVEASNVNVINQTMNMILLQRQVEGQTKLIQTRDSNLGKALAIGRTTQ